MKHLIVIFGLVVASASAGPRFDDQLREIVESFRQQMPCGFDSIGVPPLAPYTNTFKQFDFKDFGVDLSGNLTDLLVNGLDEFDVRELNYAALLMKMNFDVNFNQVKIFSQYIAEGALHLFGKPFSLVGNGDFNLLAENIRLNGSFNLRPTTSNGLKVWNFKSSFDMEGVQSKTTGIMNSPLYSRFFNSWLEESFRIILEDYKDAINKAIDNYVAAILNGQLKKVSVLELFALVLGFGSAGPLFPVCEV